jgi:hypothetical protein
MVTSKKLTKQRITTIHIVFICNILTDSIYLCAVGNAFLKKATKNSFYKQGGLMGSREGGRAANGSPAHLNAIFYGFEV